MSPLSPLVHSSLRLLTKKSYEHFLAERTNLRAVQLRVLKDLLSQAAMTSWGREQGVSAEWSYEEFAHRLPATTWSDWENWVERQRQGEEALCAHVERFQPTSGSTHARKWIPYTKMFLQEIDRASSVWMHDIYRQYPGVAHGRHYWSLSWLPNELREQMSNDDLAYFPRFKRMFLSQIMAVPESVQHAASAEVAQGLTLRHLIATEDLTLFFVWSPTFLLNMVEEIWRDRWQLSEEFTGERRAVLKTATSLAELVRRLWPRLALISCWDTADAANWSSRVQAIFPQVPLQGKGLFATEAVVTIPVAGKHHLAYQSHFYEFRRENGELIPAWELKANDVVSVLVTTGSGLCRYQLGDQVRVQEFVAGCPILRFEGRLSTVDMVGEKLSFETGREVLRQLGSHALMLLANPAGNKPGYELVWQGVGGEKEVLLAEQHLLNHHHYRLARELGQLAPVTLRRCDNVARFMQDLASEQGQILGDMKFESIVKLKGR